MSASKPQREPYWSEEDERALNNELPPRESNQQSRLRLPLVLAFFGGVIVGQALLTLYVVAMLESA